MSLFAIICTDKPEEGLRLRKENRPKHLKWLEDLGNTVVAAGPFLDEEGNPSGSLIIITACSLDKAREIAAQDPYAQAGVFEHVEIRPWKWLINKPAGL
ncbi:YciI family protein [Thermopetrobacter sp. TC1]|uniref:YciI family protein n=1 Tax=Thermopetrobacter sp. TC1 TaxID=1495045 RepID=UPI00056EAAB6|nr:YciI family protein [Thermopetrobacter sp. TC1]